MLFGRTILGLVISSGLTTSTFGEPASFKKQVLNDRYYCDGVAAGDIDGDGHIDVIAGPYCYFGPELRERSEIYPAVPLDPALSPSNSMFSFLHDFDSDGHLDVLVLGRVHRHQAFWYQNPGRRDSNWKKHFAFHRVKGESPVLQDIDGDGRPDLLTHNEKQWGWISPSATDPSEPWQFRAISETGTWPQFYHGMGLGDVDGDGKRDVILNEGIYLQPPSAKGIATWPKKEFTFSHDRGGAQMFAYDIDGDSDVDIITSLNAHEWGLAWFENQPKEDRYDFVEHTIMGTREQEDRFGVAFSQPHALELGDLDGDGLLDIVTGKRMWAHGPKGDVEPNAAPVVYWFKLVRDGNGGATYKPHLIDDASGVGVQLCLVDLDQDGSLDVLTASKLGTFAFYNQIR